MTSPAGQGNVIPANVVAYFQQVGAFAARLGFPQDFAESAAWDIAGRGEKAAALQADLDRLDQVGLPAAVLTRLRAKVRRRASEQIRAQTDRATQIHLQAGELARRDQLSFTAAHELATAAAA